MQQTKSGSVLLRLALLPVAILSLSLLVPRLQADDLGDVTRIDRQVSKIVATLMERDHLSTKPIDDSMSERAFGLYIKSLDPMKVYFLQSDIDEFEQWRTELDDQMKNGQYDFAFKVFNRFLQRVDERVAKAIEWIDADHDYTLDEEMVTDPDILQFAKDKAESDEIWRKRIKYNLLVQRNDNGEDDEKKEDPREKLRKRYSSFAKRMHQTDTQDVVQMYVTAITNSFDPHTAYMSKETFENFLISMSLELEGIGATLQGTDDGYTVIKRIVPGGAADKQGDLAVEDKIVAVGQTDSDEDMVDVTGMKLDDVVKMIRGKAGTVVRLSIVTENDESKTIAITREKIKLEDSAARGVVFEEGKKADGTPFKIGVIDLPSFYADMSGSNRGGGEPRSTTRDVERILRDFKGKGVDGVVLDLRRNGGGSLREAIDCTGLFIDNGPVVQVKDAYGEVIRHNDERMGMSWDGPLVVLTSKFSASASEILAGAVQDYGRGLVVGDTTTHGKGTVQNLINLNQLLFKSRNPPNMFGALKITMQQFYRPNGDSTQKRGVLSDVVLPSISDKMDVGESDFDYPVEFDRISSASFQPMGMVTPEMLSKIQENSQSRLQESEDFTKQIKRIKSYVEQKERKTVSLNEEKFLARRKELNADKEDEKAIEDQVNHSNEDIERDYYMNEVLRITSDYLEMLRDAKLAQK